MDGNISAFVPTLAENIRSLVEIPAGDFLGRLPLRCTKGPCRKVELALTPRLDSVAIFRNFELKISRCSKVVKLEYPKGSEI